MHRIAHHIATAYGQSLPAVALLQPATVAPAFPDTARQTTAARHAGFYYDHPAVEFAVALYDRLLAQLRVYD